MNEAPTSDPSPPGETFGEKQYAAARKRSAKLTSSQIDDRLNLMECDHVLRDEIVERLARLEACEAALRPFAACHRALTADGLRPVRDGVGVFCTARDFERAAELVPPNA